MNEHYSQVVSYFAGKAEQYDDVDQQLYWVFSDRFYREILRRELGPLISASKDVRLLDAGAGTGRWSVAFDELFGTEHHVTGTCVDISPEMLAVAERKFAVEPYTGRYACQAGNIESMPFLEPASFDIALSFYNVLSFVEHPLAAVKEVRSKLRAGGVHAAVVGNTYHAYYFSLLTKRPAELARVRDESKIKFNDLMPAMHCFTPATLTQLYLDAGFSRVEVLGGPNFLYPGMEETFVHGSTASLQQALTDETVMQSLLDLELSHYRDPGIVGRGNTLLVLGYV